MASQKQFGQETSGAEVVASFPKSVADKTFVITGPTPGGLGAQTALLLAASKPGTILLLGRDESKAAPAVESVKAVSPSTTVRFVLCDLGRYSSIKAAADSVLAFTPKIHTLINNAGVMAPAKYNTTAEGLEVQFGANHVGHFLLTNLLMPAIVAAASEGARIVNLSSMGWSLGEVRFDDYNFSDGKDYDKWSAYGQSKSANVLFTVELAKRLKSKGVHAFAVHPGVIITNLVREMDPEKDYGSMTERFNSRGHIKMDGSFPWKSLEAGTSTTLVAALDPALKDHSGTYLADCQIAETADYTTNPDYAERLWALSEKLVGQKFDL
ncbi:putative short-chain dehydrogenase protein [Botrytis fragariae]|uniref:Putative short-chain dehydrogenase protein n=1 Tax=Botrytis fragariae TaxID=1964551 RepID=A0A8H6EE11_9HELO|nr:putative short-chain dehydrogenase protein [Botrytis fragariae]KAF5868470.1 putative short-chain dehydrogenase protein [Botrytis fragariae]